MITMLGTIEPEIWVACIGTLQVLIVTFGLYFLKLSHERHSKEREVRDAENKRATEERQLIIHQLKPSNGKTVGQIIELVNDKVDLIDEKVDMHHTVVMKRMDEHETDDNARFNQLDEKLDNKLDVFDDV